MTTTVTDYTALLSGYTWNLNKTANGQPVIITYSFPTTALTYAGYSAAALASFKAFTADQQAAARQALAMWADVSGIVFLEAPAGQGDIQFSNINFNLTENAGAAGYASYPQVSSSYQYAVSGDVYVNTQVSNSPQYLLHVLVHEIGHALGLKHPFEGGVVLATNQDNWSYTEMSYTASGAGTTLGTYDVTAIQYLYGLQSADGTGVASYSWDAVTGTLTQTGGDGVDLIRGVYGNNVIYAGGGNDTVVGGFCSNVIHGGDGADTISVIAGNSAVYGDADSDILCGGAGCDLLYGGDGTDILSGGDEHDTLIGGAGSDTLDGGSNVDTAVFSGNKADYTITEDLTAVYHITGIDGADYLTNVEYAKFDDQAVRLLPTGQYWSSAGGFVSSVTTINWSADPSTYMTFIRDFNGNDVGALSSWKLIGAADVNGDGVAEHILVNRQNGRWAEVGTEADGKTYFRNYSWAGDTRVVGIYIDPLVTSGQVVAGSDTDSERRFQNDLNIENIHGVLGQADYNHDGLQEIYFSLTDGTAYLHAYMHADGNIQYANYQNEQQVKDYLTSNGFTSAAWAGWFPAGQSALAAVAG